MGICEVPNDELNKLVEFLRGISHIPCYKIVKIMEENEIKIGHDISATDTYFIVTALLDKLGIKYEESGEETITIKYWVERK